MDLIVLEHYTLTAAFIACMVATVLYLGYLRYKNENLTRIAKFAAVIGFLSNLVLIGVRWKLGYAPFSSGFEFMVAFILSITGIYLLAEWRNRNGMIGAFVMPIALLLLAYLAMFMPEQQNNVEDLMKVFESKWLTIHVTMAVLAYGSFATAFGTSIMYLIKQNMEKNESNSVFNERMPSLEVLDDLSFKFTAVGFTLLTIVITVGAVAAEFSWGRYWSWDPKETWSLVTWLVYASYLHARFTKGFRGSRAALMSVTGFLFVLLTLFGAKYFFSGHHSYGKTT